MTASGLACAGSAGAAAGCASAAVVAVVALARRPLLFVAFDPEMARTLGVRTALWNWLFYLLLGVAVAAVTKGAGSLVTFSFLVVPAMTALAMANGIFAIFAVAVGSAVLAAVGGLWASYTYDLPTGPAMVVLSAILLALGAGLAAGWRRLRAPKDF